MKKAVIEVKNLSKEFKTYQRKEGLIEALKSLFIRKYKIKKAVDKINFTINKGEIVGYIGPNGAGKSTTIKMMVGILVPDSGSVKSLSYNPWNQRKEYVANIGIVLGQKSQLWWDLPPVDSFSLLKAIYGIPKKDFDKRVEELTRLLNVKDISKTPVRNLSLGERMRCEFIAAMLHNPKILFLDEPTIGLDAVAKEEIREFIKRINRKNKTTVILTTHNMDEIEELCRRIILIDKGKIIYDGPLAKIRKKYVRTKRVTVELAEKVADLTLPQGCSLISGKNYRHEIEVNMGKASVSALISYLINNFDVTDVTIEEPKIEKIIKSVYEEHK